MEYKIIRIKKEVSEFDPRFVVIDPETGQVLDDANGYGYKSYENARKAFFYKLRNYPSFLCTKL